MGSKVLVVLDSGSRRLRLSRSRSFSCSRRFRRLNIRLVIFKGGLYLLFTLLLPFLEFTRISYVSMMNSRFRHHLASDTIH